MSLKHDAEGFLVGYWLGAVTRSIVSRDVPGLLQMLKAVQV